MRATSTLSVRRLVLATATLVSACQAAQIPLIVSAPAISSSRIARPWHVEAVDEWRFDQPPSPNATANFIFDTVASVLQHWHHTRYRNGHTLIPGYVPTGTLLYHGASSSKIPDVPEWTATDPEHSYMFCRGQEDAGCWHLTLAAVRPLKVLYFDGSSAAKMIDGPMHTQDIVAWGEVRPDRYFDERNRIKDLCDWGRPYGIDGYVRMEMDFEIMLCNFTNGVEVVSWSNLRSSRGPGRPGGGPDRDPPPQGPDEDKDDDPASPPSPGQPIKVPNSGSSNVFISGSWHNRYPGDTRVVLHTHRLISFYDTALVPSLVPARARAETRFEHSLAGITVADARAVMGRLEAYYAGQTGRDADGDRAVSGVDWQTLAKVLVDRHADRLELARYLFNESLLALGPADADADAASSSPAKALALAQRALTEIHGVVFPYALHSARMPADPADTARMGAADGAGPHAWAVPVWQECADAHTRAIARRAARLTQSERTLLRAVRETKREICRVAVGIWADAEGRTFGASGGDGDAGAGSGGAGEVDEAALRAAVGGWLDGVVRLMDWLDWSVWVRCRPACGYEEYCYLPTWPFMRQGGSGSTDSEGEGEGEGEGETGFAPEPPRRGPRLPDDDSYKRPQPVCIRRFENY